MGSPITHDLTSDGFAFFQDGKKLAVVGCVTEGPKTTRNGENGQPIRDNQGHILDFPTVVGLPRSSWAVHFTSPSVNVELLEAIVAAIPKGDDHTEHTSERKAM